jgi:hypothetical protein
MPISDCDIDLTTQYEILKRIRSKLFFIAALALKNNIDLTDELEKIFGEESPLRKIPKHKITIIPAEVVKRIPLNPRETNVMELFYMSTEPITMDEIVAKLSFKADTRCSKSSVTTTVKVLQGMRLIGQANNEDGIQGYIKLEAKNNGTPNA